MRYRLHQVSNPLRVLDLWHDMTPVITRVSAVKVSLFANADVFRLGGCVGCDGF